MGNSVKNCCCATKKKEPITVLVLGLESSGKTDITFRIINKPRTDFMPTNGCRVYSTKMFQQSIKFTELGGAFFDIWRYYYLETFAVIYVIDATDTREGLEKSKQVFSRIMSNEFLIGKPFLILANKQDSASAVDFLDICEFFEIEYLANLFQTPCLIEGCGSSDDQSLQDDGLLKGLQWLLKTINKNYRKIQNQIQFLHAISNRESMKREKMERSMTGKRKKKLKTSPSRPKTAPTFKTSFSKKKNYLKISKKPPLPPARQFTNKVIPTENEASNNTNNKITNGKIVHVQEMVHSTPFHIYEEIVKNDTEIFIEDLSLPAIPLH